jgi:hypothetical protein
MKLTRMRVFVPMMPLPRLDEKSVFFRTKQSPASGAVLDPWLRCLFQAHIPGFCDDGLASWGLDLRPPMTARARATAGFVVDPLAGSHGRHHDGPLAQGVEQPLPVLGK